MAFVIDSSRPMRGLLGLRRRHPSGPLRLVGRQGNQGLFSLIRLGKLGWFSAFWCCHSNSYQTHSVKKFRRLFSTTGDPSIRLLTSPPAP